MERVMSVEEKIRRAEEIYQRRKQGEIRPVAKVTVNDKKDIKLLKKMLIQLLICAIIYVVVYAIHNNQYVFSEDFINKANNILSYDTNFAELYEMVKGQIMNIIENQQNQEENTNNEDINQENTSQENTNQEGVTQDGIGGAQEGITQEQTVENLSQEEIDIQNIKNTTTFIKPVEGTISSVFGQRDTATGRVPKNHTGTDIAANLGTKIKSATNGEVVLASEEGDYRKALKNSNW